MAIPVQEFVTSLTSRHRVVVIGGLAVIGHGLSRPTKDADIWLEPMPTVSEWADAVSEVVHQFGEQLTLHRLPGWTLVNGQDELVEAIDEVGMIRVIDRT
jgi:hypothetical protein